MITDVIAVKHGQAEFSWGAGANLVAEGGARAAYLAALRALDGNENEVKPLLAFCEILMSMLVRQGRNGTNARFRVWIENSVKIPI
jgi:hypothetical protein